MQTHFFKNEIAYFFLLISIPWVILRKKALEYQSVEKINIS